MKLEIQVEIHMTKTKIILYTWAIIITLETLLKHFDYDIVFINIFVSCDFGCLIRLKIINFDQTELEN